MSEQAVASPTVARLPEAILPVLVRAVELTLRIAEQGGGGDG